jgi:hypothetical protein
MSQLIFENGPTNTPAKLPNIVFLDIDGVLCNPRACIAMGDIGGVFSYLDPVACMLVRRICEEKDAKLVISSSWRILYDRFSIQAILNAACPKLGRYMFMDERWCTPSHNGGDGFEFGRGREIQSWIRNYSAEFNRFVILDDDSDMDPYMDSLVKCDTYNGIGFHEYQSACKILKEE